MFKHNFSILLLTTVMFLAACRKSQAPFECTDAIGCVTIAPGEPVKIGVLQDLSGGAVNIGIDQLQAMELAVAQRDEQLLGHPIELQIEDEGCTAEGGSVAAHKLASDPQVLAVLGTTCSGSAVTAAEVVAEAGLVMISGSNSAPGLTSVGGERGADWQPGYFRTMLNDAGNGYAAAVFAFEELGVTQAATMNDGDAYTRGSTDAFSQVFAQLGGEIVLETTINKGDTNMLPVLTAVADHEAQLLFLALFSPEGIQVVQQAQEIPGVKDILLIGTGSLRAEDFIQAIGTHGLGMYFVGAMPPPASAAGDKLLAAYQARYGVLPNTNNYTFAYDAANLLLDAIASLAVQEADGTLHIGRQALRDALYAVTAFQGVTGRLACDEFGDCGVPRYNIVRLDDPAAGRQGLESNVVYTYTPGQ
jgi:branched-chain amino acid transport system substrate-binding protein